MYVKDELDVVVVVRVRTLVGRAHDGLQVQEPVGGRRQRLLVVGEAAEELPRAAVVVLQHVLEELHRQQLETTTLTLITHTPGIGLRTLWPHSYSNNFTTKLMSAMGRSEYSSVMRTCDLMEHFGELMIMSSKLARVTVYISGLIFNLKYREIHEAVNVLVICTKARNTHDRWRWQLVYKI